MRLEQYFLRIKKQYIPGTRNSYDAPQWVPNRTGTQGYGGRSWSGKLKVMVAEVDQVNSVHSQTNLNLHHGWILFKCLFDLIELLKGSAWVYNSGCRDNQNLNRFIWLYIFLSKLWISKPCFVECKSLFFFNNTTSVVNYH